MEKKTKELQISTTLEIRVEEDGYLSGNRGGCVGMEDK